MVVKKVCVEACGCSFSLSDAELARGLLEKAGHRLTPGPDEAEVIVLVTCTVKDTTQAKLEKRISELAKSGKKLVVAGCLPQHAPDIVRRLAPKAILVGPRGITRIADALEARSGTIFAEKTESNKLGLPRLRSDALRATVPIAEGCLGECSYCATRLAKGALTSFSRDDILDEMRSLVSKGYKEIWLTAQDCAAWGLDSKGNVCDLLSSVSQISGDFRVRVGMLNPAHLLPILGRFLETFSSDSMFFRFFHIPVQSGSDEVLARMKRGYSRRDFLSIVSAIRENFPDACLSTDVIAGFPGETEAQFEETAKILEEARPDIVNVSRFCPRPSTPAALFGNRLPGSKVKERTRILSSIHRAISLEKNKGWIGRTCRVFVDEQTPKGPMGRTGDYRPVAIMGKAKLGRHATVKIVGASRSYLMGELLA